MRRQAPLLTALLTAFAVGGGYPALAQNLGLVVRDGSMGAPPRGVVPPGTDDLGQHANYLIGAELGEQVGSNLFHSFEQFSIGTGEVATFTGPMGLENVVSRVTGGGPSSIDGTLRSTIEGADVYLLNPAGLLFGPSGELDVQGSFHASTADRLEFSDGTVLEVADPQPLLTVASPVEFGFLDGNVAPIVVGEPIRGGIGGAAGLRAGPGIPEAQDGLRVGAGEALSLLGAGDVTIVGSVLADSSFDDAGSVTVRGGTVFVEGSVAAGPTDIGLEQASGASVLLEAAGEVTISGSIRADGEAGNVTVRGGTVSVERSGSVTAGGFGPGSWGSVLLEAAGEATIAGSIRADSSTEDAGSVTVRGGTVSVERSGSVTAESFGIVDGGRIELEGERILLRGQLSAAARGSGRPGSIVLLGDVDVGSAGLVALDDSFGEAGVVPGGLDPSGQLVHYLIGPELGQQAGENLFHSFARFGIGPGEIASFTGPDPLEGPQSVARIVSRVTGGSASELFGTLRSTVPGADLYLLNPAGLVFGNGAQLDVAGSFHASPADRLEFERGDFLEAELAGIVPEAGAGDVAAFRFLSEAPASLAIEGASLAVPEGETLSLIAGDIEIQGRGVPPPDDPNFVRLSIDSLDGFASFFPDPGAALAQLLADPERFFRELFTGDLAVDAGWLDLVEPDRRFFPMPGPRAATLLAPGGRIEIVGVQSPGWVGRGAQTSGFDGLGGLRISDVALISVEGPGPGSLTLRGDDLTVVGSILTAEGGSSADGGEIRIDVDGAVRIQGVEHLIEDPAPRSADVSVEDLGRGFFFYDFVPVSIDLPAQHVTRGSTLRALGTDPGGSGIHAEGGEILISGGSTLRVSAGVGSESEIALSAGSVEIADSVLTAIGSAPGTISIAGSSASILGESQIRVRGGIGDGGLSLTGGEIAIRGGPQIESTTFDGPGVDIVIRADDLRLVDGSQIRSSSFRGGVGGGISIEAGTIHVEGGSRISSEAYGSGRGGDIDVVGRESVLVSGTGPVFSAGRSEISALTLGLGNSGSLQVTTPLLRVRDATLETGTNFFESSGRGGDLTLAVGELEVESLALVSTGTSGKGSGGDLRITADRSVVVSGNEFTLGVPIRDQAQGIVTLTSRGSLLQAISEGFAEGDAGDLYILAPELTVRQNGVVTTSSVFSVGAAGNIEIEVDRLSLASGGLIDSSAAVGPAGEITIEASESVEIRGESGQDIPSRIRSFTAGPEDGGSIHVTTPVLVLDGGVIGTTSLGLIELLNGLGLFPATSGNAGDVLIDAGEVTLREGGLIDSSTFGSADGGRVLLGFVAPVPFVSIEGGATGLQSQTAGAGRGGQVEVRAGRLLVSDEATIASRAGSGSPAVRRALTDLDVLLGSVLGLLGIDIDEFFKADRPDSTGNGGSVVLTGAHQVSITGGVVTTESIGLGDAGDVRIVAGDNLRLSGGSITARASSSSGGNIQLLAGELLHLVDSGVSADVGGGVGGNIDMTTSSVVLDRSRITAQAGAGRGGSIRVVSDVFVADPRSLVDASAGNPELSGSVEINAPDTDLAAKITKLPESYFDASSMLRQHCAARGGASGSFTTASGGAPAGPDGFLSASMLEPAKVELLSSLRP